MRSAAIVVLGRQMSELTKSLVLAGAFVAFILAAYMQEGGSWRGPHSLRKSLHPKGTTVGMQEDRYGCDGDTGLFRPLIA
jgi:hypothetical protein